MGNTIRRLLIISLALTSVFMASAQVPADYQARYANLTGKSGATLVSELESIVAIGYDNVGYDGLYEAYRQTDMDENGYLLDMYSTCQFTLNNKCGNYNSVCDCFNREHSLPKSWWGGGKNSCYSDLFHLVPTDGKVNNQRAAHPFGECANGGSLPGGHALGRLGSSTLAGYTNIGTVFEPADQYKGDFARGYLGMLIHFGNSVAFTSAEGSKTFSNSGRTLTAANHFGLTAYGVALLMKWNRQDPVSPKEVKRNTGMQATQGNRNPFIDCPILAEYIWGDKVGESVLYQDLVNCGCISDSTYSAIGDVVAAEPTDYVSRLASVSLSRESNSYELTCLPPGTRILFFSAQGQLLHSTRTELQSYTFSRESLGESSPNGLLLILLAIDSETRTIKLAL